MSKVVATYTGRFDVFEKLSNIKIQIISVPKQKNKIVMTGQRTLIPGFPKNINGSLLSVKKLIHDEKTLGWKLKPTKMYGLSIRYQNRGSHQGGPMHNFKDVISVWSKDEKHIDKLLQFLEKHITKKKVRRTKKKSKTRRKKKKTQKGGRKLKKIKKRSHNKTKMNISKGKNKALEKLWTDMSNMKKYVYIMKDDSYQIKSVEPSYKGQRGSDFHLKYCLPMIEKANNDDSVKAILTAGNSYDGYRQLYDDVGNSSVDKVLKDYKKYWKYQIDKKLYTC